MLQGWEGDLDLEQPGGGDLTMYHEERIHHESQIYNKKVKNKRTLVIGFKTHTVIPDKSPNLMMQRCFFQIGSQSLYLEGRTWTNISMEATVDPTGPGLVQSCGMALSREVQGCPKASQGQCLGGTWRAE